MVKKKINCGSNKIHIVSFLFGSGFSLEFLCTYIVPKTVEKEQDDYL